MAGRQLHRLPKQQLPVESPSSDTDVSEEEDEDSNQSAFNPFSLLTDEDEVSKLNGLKLP